MGVSLRILNTLKHFSSEENQTRADVCLKAKIEMSEAGGEIFAALQLALNEAIGSGSHKRASAGVDLALDAEAPAVKQVKFAA